MADRQIVIRVGLSLDASMGTAMVPFTESLKRARAAAETEGRNIGRAVGTGVKSGADAAEKAFDALVKSVEKGGKGLSDPIVAATKKAASEGKSNFDRLAADAEAAFKRIETAQKEAQAKAAATDKWIGQHVSGVSLGNVAGGVMSGISTSFNMATRVASGLARGMGVDLDPVSHMQKAAALESTVTDLSASAFMGGQVGAKGANAQRQDPKALLADIRKVANDTATDTNRAAEGLQAFVGLTGDLALGRNIFGDLAKLTKATGSNLDDMLAAAGNVANGLGIDTSSAEGLAEASKQTLEVMRALAGQGKLGAVEIKDLSSQMAGLAAQAGRFTGDRSQTMALMGALAQESRQAGGSKSAAQAVTSVQSFVNTFDKGAREKAFSKFGVKTRDESGLLRNAQDIIVDSLLASKGDANKMGQMFADVRARSTTRGFENIFNKTRTETQGNEQQKLAEATRAVRDEFDRLTKVAMGQGEIQDSFNAAMSTSASAATIMNNKFTEVAGDLMDRLKPIFIELAPLIGDFASAVGDAAKKILGIVTGTDTSPEKASMDAFTESREKVEHALAAKQGSGEGFTEEDTKAYAADQAAAAAKIDQLKRRAFENTEKLQNMGIGTSKAEKFDTAAAIQRDLADAAAQEQYSKSLQARFGAALPNISADPKTGLGLITNKERAEVMGSLDPQGGATGEKAGLLGTIDLMKGVVEKHDGVAKKSNDAAVMISGAVDRFAAAVDRMPKDGFGKVNEGARAKQ